MYETKLIIIVILFLVAASFLFIYYIKKMIELSYKRRLEMMNEVIRQHQETINITINKAIADNVTLSNKDYDQLLDNLLNPPQPNQKLVELMKEKEDNK